MRGRATVTTTVVVCTLTLSACTSAFAADGGVEYDPTETAPGGTEYGSALKELPKKKTKPRKRPESQPAAKRKTVSTPRAPGQIATLVNGVAHAPQGAPPEVVQAIAAGNRLQGKPYKYGGGHKNFEEDAYDCSGTVSYALHAANLLDSPLDSGSLMKWGEAGAGKWITVYTNKGHAYIVIAGLRLDTSRVGAASTPRASISRRRDETELGTGPLWQTAERPSDGFELRHPAGL